MRFVGTADPDSIDIQNTNTFWLTGEGAGDSIVYSAQVLRSFLSGGDGNDSFTGNVLGGAVIVESRLNGNAGADTFGNPQLGISVSNSRPSVTLATPRGNQTAGILGGADGDTMYLGNIQASRVNGNDGKDTIFTGVRTDAAVNISDAEIFGGKDDDVINVGNASYINTLIGGNEGNDTINVAITNANTLANLGTNVRVTNEIFNNSSIDGGEGDDFIDASETRTVNIFDPFSLSALTTVPGLNLAGGNGNDTVVGGDAGDTINGGEGADSLLGSFGRDTINGGNEDDIIEGGANADTLSGGTGNNRFRQRDGSTGPVTYFQTGTTATGFTQPFTTSGTQTTGFTSFETATATAFTSGTATSGTATSGLTTGTQIVVTITTATNTSTAIITNTGTITSTVTSGATATNSVGNLLNQTINNGNRFEIVGGADIITDWDLGAINSLDTGVVGNLLGNGEANMSVGNTLTAAALVNGENIAMRGTYNASLQTFVVDEFQGQDIGVVTVNSAGELLDNFVVLQGSGGSVLNDTDFARIAA